MVVFKNQYALKYERDCREKKRDKVVGTIIFALIAFAVMLAAAHN